MADKEELVQKAKLAEQAERLVKLYIFFIFHKKLEDGVEQCSRIALKGPPYRICRKKLARETTIENNQFQT